jgi:frataxin
LESEAEYHRIADETLEGLQDQLEQVLETVPQTPTDMDISYASGVLTIALPPHGTWVLNKQTPNRVRPPQKKTANPKSLFIVALLSSLTHTRMIPSSLSLF